MATVTIDNKDMEQFQKNLTEIAAQLSRRYLSAYSEKIAKYQRGKVENRYKNSGPNEDGKDWLGIRLSSFMRRSTAQKTAKGRLSEHGKRVKGYAQMLYFNTRLDPREVHPFILSGGPREQSKKDVKPYGDGYLVEIGPLLKNARGEFIAEFAKGGGKGWQPKRAAFYLSVEDKKEIIAEGLRTIDQMVKDMIK